MSGIEILEAFRLAAAGHTTDEVWQQKKNEAFENNRWFVPENINQALNQWLESLKPENVVQWIGGYTATDSKKTLGIVMAGNIPFVGMHDLLCGLICGYKLRVKVSSEDEVLTKFWTEKAVEILPELEGRIVFSESMKDIDVAIATGSNNTARYFEYYFKNIPHLLRKNRNSVSVLAGNETEDSLVLLGHDVFDYFGLGCRNVTHLFLPKGYEFKPLFDAWEKFSDIQHHHKYANNYTYHKALLLLNLDPHMDTGFLLVKERDMIYSPVGMINYSFYSNLNEVKERLANHSDEIQCVTSEISGFGLKLGDAQKTMLWDYADNVNTLDWLKTIN